jgi:hypothetical protein
MQQGPSREADSRSTGKEIPRLLLNPKVHYHVIHGSTLNMEAADSSETLTDITRLNKIAHPKTVILAVHCHIHTRAPKAL